MELSRIAFVLSLTLVALAIFMQNQHGHTMWHFLCKLFTTSWSEADMLKILQGWEKFIFEPEETWNSVVIGFNANLDLVVPAIPLLLALNVSIPKKAVDHSQLSSYSDLGETFAFHFSRGAAAERPFLDCNLFKEILQVANNLPGVKRLVGGNAAIMSQVLHQVKHLPHSSRSVVDTGSQTAGRPSTNVTLIASLGPQLRELLSKETHVVEASKSLYDEVHVIMEYGVEEEWRGQGAHHAQHQSAYPVYRSAVANRFIFSCDVANTQLQHATHLSLVASEKNTACDSETQKDDTSGSCTRNEASRTLLIISGFHMMEAIPTVEEWHSRLQVVVDSIQRTTSSPLVHLELASMTSRRRTALLATHLFPAVVDSLGLNEQELAFLSQAGGGPHTSLYVTAHTSPSEEPLAVYVAPSVERVVDCVAWLLKEDWREDNDDNRMMLPRLRRVHFHTLAYHLLAVRVNRADPKAWSLSQLASAVSAGAREASRRACNTTVPEPKVSVLRIPDEEFRLGSHGPFAKFGREQYGDSQSKDPYIFTWEESVGSSDGETLIRFAMSPVLVCKAPLQTVGLGDSISITGLLYTPVK